MAQLLNSFTTLPDWSLDPVNYPPVFLIDQSWADDTNYAVLAGSKTTHPLTGITPLAYSSEDEEQQIHGELTQHVIQYMARGLLNQNITHVSAKRDPDTLFSYHLPQALLMVEGQLRSKPGSLIVINLGSGGAGDSFVSDPLIPRYLKDITDRLGGIVIIAAGNIKARLNDNLAPDAVVAGAVDTNGQVQSRYGQGITCYAVTPYKLPGLPPEYFTPVIFQNSSAATAYTAGMVLMMLNYAKSKGKTLTSKQVVELLKNNGTSFPLLADPDPTPGTGILPDWNLLKKALD